MKTVDLAEATEALSAYADDLDDEPLILTVKGQPIAALVSLKHADRLNSNQPSARFSTAKAVPQRTKGDGVERLTKRRLGDWGRVTREWPVFGSR